MTNQQKIDTALKENREELVESLASFIVESWDMDDLIEFAVDQLTQELQESDDDNLRDTIEDLDFTL